MVDLSVSEKQRQLAQEFEKQQQKMQEDYQQKLEIYNVCEKEAEAISKFLKEKVKLRPTLVMYKMAVAGKGEKEVDMPVDYCLGKDIHFTVLTHRKEILAMAK
jgi:small-conductance mechanosensitive channel